MDQAANKRVRIECMAKGTPIQWTDDTVNPTLGCDGCELWNDKLRVCYAGLLTNRFGSSNSGLADDFDQVELVPGRMMPAARSSELLGAARGSKPWLNYLPRLIFIGDMSDTFSKIVTFEHLRDEVIRAVTSQMGQLHQWQWLTKRPNRMAKFSAWLQEQSIPWPLNLWASTSVTAQATTTRIDSLLNVGDEQTVRFVSVEPQWEPIDLRPWLSRLDWVIQGGQSGSHDHPFAMEWADDLRKQCRKHRTAYFLKQLGSCVTYRGERVRTIRGHGGDWDAWPRRLRVRQMPIYVGRRNRAIRQRRIERETSGAIASS
jgi:protein gp37